MRALVRTSGRIPDFAVRVCRSFRERMRGLLGTGPQAMPVLIERCRSVHTFGMRYALDLAFVCGDGSVGRVCRNVEPGRLRSCRDATYVLERPHALTAWVAGGDCVRVDRIDAQEGGLP